MSNIIEDQCYYVVGLEENNNNMSQRTVKGVISRTDAKDFPSRSGQGNTTLYSFQLEGVGQWFRAGERPLNAGRGDQVEFVVDGQKVDRNTFRVVQNVVQAAPTVVQSAAPTVSRPSASTETAQGAGSRDEYWVNKEARDLVKEERYRAVSEPRMALSVSTEAASRLVSVALQTDSLGFGTAAKSKRLSLITKYVKETALDLATFIENAPEEMAAYKASLSDVVDVVEDNNDNE